MVAVVDAEFLQTTFARLVADRAIEWMINEQKFHDAAAAFLRERRIGAHAHAVGDILRATNLRARHPINNGLSIRTEFRFAIGTHARHSHFDQTHAAVAGRAEFFVIAITRDEKAGLLARFDYACSFWELMPHAVDLDVEQGSRFVRHD